jgi:parvulin-like peptidyl-prolyl isomerase
MWTLGLVTFVACRGPGEPSPDAASGDAGLEARDAGFEAGDAALVARFGELEITASDLDSHILALPPNERPKPGEDLDAWYSELIREYVVDERLRAEAEDLVEDEAFATARRDAEKQLAVHLCLDELRPGIDVVTDDALRAAYDERVDAFAVPERRDVFHLFLRYRPGASRNAFRAEIESWRDQVLGGESFQRLAGRHSDSESRHREGGLGWVTPGQLPAGFEDVIFRLEEGVPSEPVATRDGLHLFYVDRIAPARQAPLEEVSRALAARLVAERREAALAELETAAEAPPEPPGGSVVLDRAGFAAVAEAGDPGAFVLRLGGTELTLADLRREVRQAVARQSARGLASQGLPQPAPELAWQVLESLRRREVLAHHCRKNGQVPAGEFAARLAAWQREALLDLQRQRRLIEVAGGDESRLRLFYESNVGLFSKPPRWHLRRLRIPIGDGAGAAMARLEEAAAHPGASLEELAAELGGDVEDLGTKSLAELRLLDAKLPPLVAPLGSGELSPPYRTAVTLELVESLARQEAEPLPFAEVRERVAAAYVEQYTQEVYREMAEEILRTAELEISPEGLAALRDAGAPGEVSVEQLEELLSEL